MCTSMLPALLSEFIVPRVSFLPRLIANGTRGCRYNDSTFVLERNQTMSRSSGVLIVVSLAALVVPGSLFAGSLKPGLWKTTTTVDMPEMSVKLKPTTVETCLTEEQASDPQASLPKGPGKDCKVTDYKADGNKVSWSVACASTPPLRGTGKLTFENDSAYKAVLKLILNDHAMTLMLDAHRSGECK